MRMHVRSFAYAVIIVIVFACLFDIICASTSAVEQFVETYIAFHRTLIAFAFVVAVRLMLLCVE